MNEEGRRGGSFSFSNAFFFLAFIFHFKMLATSGVALLYPSLSLLFLLIAGRLTQPGPKRQGKEGRNEGMKRALR